MNSKLLGRKTEKHKIQMLSGNGGLKADEDCMSAVTSWVRDIAREICFHCEQFSVTESKSV